MGSESGPMRTSSPGDFSATTTQLLDGLHDPNNAAVWSSFDARYRPIVHAVALRLGLQPEDAGDVAQQTMIDFFRDYQAGTYQRGRGRLRSWIRGIARNRTIDVLRAEGRRRISRGESAIDAVPDEESVRKLWEVEERRLIWKAAMDEVRAESRFSEVNLLAFEMIVVRGLTPEAAAEHCGISIDQAYQAKSRIMARVHAIIERLQAAHETDD